MLERLNALYESQSPYGAKWFATLIELLETLARADEVAIPLWG